MSQLFLKSTNKGLTGIQKAIDEKNYEAISEVCHKMAAPCKHFHANDLYNSIKKLENQAKDSTGWTEIYKQTKLLEVEINDVNKIITETFSF